VTRRKKPPIAYVGDPVQDRWRVVGARLAQVNAFEFDKLLGLAELFVSNDDGADESESVFQATLKFCRSERQAN